MSLLKIIPQIFYKEINDGIDLFVHALGFKIVYQSTETDPFYILEREGITVYLIQNTDFTNGERPELRIATNDIESAYQEVKSRKVELLHPNLKKIKQQPWGLKEFALLDKTGVCIIIQQTAD